MRDYGFSQSISNYNKLIQIFELLDKDIEIIDKVLILPDNYQDIIGNLSFGLSKKFYTYKSKLFSKAMTRQEWNQYLYKCEQQKNKEKEKLKKQQKEQEYYKSKIKELCLGKTYRNKKWIDENIGVYYTNDIALEYFWTIIGNEYYQEWNGDIILTDSKLNEIKSIEESVVGLKGTTFLSRKFIYKNKYSHCINTAKTLKKTNKEVEAYGVYGIYKNDCLMYIGSTMRDFSIRFNEHIENIKSKSNELYVYSLLNKEDNITFKVLINAKQLNTNTTLTRRDIESMELGLITVYKPPGNLAGTKYEFKYRM